jgi:hypothetical protein
MLFLRFCQTTEYIRTRRVLLCFCKGTVQRNAVLFLDVVFLVATNVGGARFHPDILLAYAACSIRISDQRDNCGLPEARCALSCAVSGLKMASSGLPMLTTLVRSYRFYNRRRDISRLCLDWRHSSRSCFRSRWRPLVLNVVGIVIQIMPVQFLLSSRCRELGSFAGRCLFAFLYLGLPNSNEMHVNITNAYWRLALLALLILFSLPGRSMLWNIFDYSVLALCALTGPLIIFIVPIAGVLYLSEKRTPRRRTLLIVCAVGAAIEVLSVLIAGGSERVVDAVRGATHRSCFFRFWQSRCSLRFWWEDER